MSDDNLPGSPASGIDALLPAQIAVKAEDIGVAKAGMAPLRLLTLAVLAGAFISDTKGYMRSLFHYSVDQDTFEKRVLVIDKLFSPEPRSTRMLEEIRSWTLRHATNCSCQTIRVVDDDGVTAT